MDASSRRRLDPQGGDPEPTGTVPTVTGAAAGPVDDATIDPLLGATLNGRFEIVEPIARGGMGRVYRAIQQPLGRLVALKVLDIRGHHDAEASSEFHKRFFREAASAAKLTHPNTIVIFDYGMSESSVYYIAMELLEGRTLMQALRDDGPLAPERVIHISLQMCAALSEAHARGLVHRDLKPSNIVLTRRGHDPDFVKVLDFGLVKVLGDELPDDDRTVSGVMMGTPRYMSPEQIRGKDVGPAADVYSLGAVIYHALTGRPPFDGESKFDVLAAHVGVPPASFRESYPGCRATPRLEQTVMKCLAKDPAYRFASMDDLAATLQLCGQEIWGDSPPSGSARIPRELMDSKSNAPTSHQIKLPPSGSERARISSASMRSGPVGDASMTGPGAAPEWDSLAPTPGPRGRPAAVVPAPSVTELVAPPEKRGGVKWWVGVLIVLLAGGGAAAASFLGLGGGTGTSPGNVVEEQPTTTTTTPTTTPSVSVGSVPAGQAATEVVLMVEPAGAHVRRDGVDLGDAPLRLRIPPGEEWLVEVSARGYRTRTMALGQQQGEVRLVLEREAVRGGGRRGGGGGGRQTDNRDPWAN